MVANHVTQLDGNDSTETEQIISQKLDMVAHNHNVKVVDITNVWCNDIENHYVGPISDGSRSIKINYRKSVETHYISSNEEFGSVWVVKIKDNGIPQQVLLYANQRELITELLTIRQIVGDKL